MISKSRLAVFFSFFAFVIINFQSHITRVVIDLILSSALAFAVIKSKVRIRTDKIFFRDNTTAFAVSCFISLILGLRFYNYWTISGAVTKIYFGNAAIANILLIIVTLLLSAGSSLILSAVISRHYNSFYSLKTLKADKKISVKAFVTILITSVVCITLCSKCSPIYPFNDWFDTNCFFTVGKSVTNGTVLYRDIYEQKGPLLYFMHTAAYLVSHTSFLGVYFFELISCFAFLFISYKTMIIFTDSDISYTIPIIGTIIYGSFAFTRGGTAEEYCLPCLALCNYFGMKALASKKKISFAQCFAVSITSGAVLWIKFSVLGFYIGFGLFFAILYLKNRWISDILKSLLALAAGIAVISAPILAYFLFNNALPYVFKVYFYDNLFLYSVNGSGNTVFSTVNNLYSGLINVFENHFPGLIFIFAGIFYYLRDRRQLALITVTFISSFFFLFSGGRHYAYYSFALSVFVPFGFLLFDRLFRSAAEFIPEKIKNKKITVASSYAVLGAVCLAIMLNTCPNIYLLKYQKDNMPQYKFDKIISEVDNPTLLNYGFLDGGFYTVSDIMPTCKYFCGLNIPYPEIQETQDYYVKNGLTDFVVTYNEPLAEDMSGKYEFVTTEKFEYKQFYLYKRV